MRLLRLSLTDFRNYAALTWRPGARISVLFGPNGSGKTNLLEAVSLLVPGRALRGARNADLPRHGGAGGWAVAGRFATADGEVDIGTGSARLTARHRSPRVPPRRRRAAQPGGDRRPCGGRVAHAADGPPVPGGHVRAAAASSTGWCGRWNPATRARSRRTTPPWRSATGCWRMGGPIRAGLPGWRMRWRGTPWRPPRRAWRWWRG